MIIGIPKEIKNNENRVGMTPAGVAELTRRGHQVYVQHEAGQNSGFADEAYVAVGAAILPTIEETYARAEMIVKVKEPIAPEYGLIRPGQVLFTYFHFAADRTLTEAMLKSGAVCLAYETVEKADHSLPLLMPMSEVAGRMSVQEGARFLERPQGGKGILLGGVPGVRPARVLILGGGTVGTNAAWMAAGLGAEVTIADINLDRLRYLSEIMPKNVTTLYSSGHNIRTELPTTDLVIGSVLIPGDKAPHLITRDMLPLMKPGSVHRPGRLLRDLAPHHAQRTGLHPGRHRALCRGQHPRRRALHLDAGPDQRHPALHHRPGLQGLETGLPRRPGPGPGAQRGGRQSDLQGRGRRVRAAL